MSATIQAALHPYAHMIKEIRHCPQGAGCVHTSSGLRRVYWLVSVSGWTRVDRIQSYLNRKGIHALVVGSVM